MLQELGFADILLEFAYVDANYNQPELSLPVGVLTQPNKTKRALFELGNTSRQQGFAWQAEYQFRRLEYEFSRLE